MSRFTGSKTKLSRRFGVNIFGLEKIDKIIAKRLGKRRGIVKKQSEFGIQLKEKQLARFMFGLTEKQLKKYYDKAVRSKAVTSEEFVRLLETRLDNVIYRAGFAESRPQARQMVAHGHLEFNGRKVTIPSIEVKAGDVISVKKKSQSSPLFEEFIPIQKNIKWIKPDIRKKQIQIDNLPEADEMEQSIKTHLIVEYYSRR